MEFGIISLFPEMFSSLEIGISGRARRNHLVDWQIFNPRDHCKDKHRSVDDRPFGGGPGMLMKVEPLRAAINEARQCLPRAKVYYLSPQGELLKQDKVKQLSQEPEIILLAGRYEGIDERIINQDIDGEISIGDYVLSGGELAAMVLMDAMIRLQPNALGNKSSANEDSFARGLLDHPHYTRPEIIANTGIPKVLSSGDHRAIARWRKQQALGRTWLRRPDLLATADLSVSEQELLREFIANYCKMAN